MSDPGAPQRPGVRIEVDLDRSCIEVVGGLLRGCPREQHGAEASRDEAVEKIEQSRSAEAIGGLNIVQRGGELKDL